MAGTSDAVRARRETLLLVVGIVLLSFNLRSAITVVGPLIGDLRDTDHLSGTAVGVLTAAPLLGFGLIAPLGPVLAVRFGLERALLGCMAVLAASLALRPLPVVALLFLGTLAAGAAIAIANVLLPALMKRRFPARAAFMTGIYSVALGIGAALGAGLAVPTERWLGGSWRAALAIWTVPVLLAIVVWLPQLRRAPTRAEIGPRVRINLWRDRIAWNVTGFMAIQSLLFYSMVAWLPEIYRHHGMSKGSAGALLSLALIVGVPLGLAVAVAAGRMRDQRPLAAGAVALAVAGYLGVLLIPSAAPSLWAVLLGCGFGTGFTLVLALMVLRASDAHHAAELSGMAQSVGYTLAALGPIAIGALHDATGAWTAPLIVLVALALLELPVALGASRPGFVRGRPATAAPETAADEPVVVGSAPRR